MYTENTCNPVLKQFFCFEKMFFGLKKIPHLHIFLGPEDVAKQI